jgi:predicted anti-sigma-YlaC factor YlaD
MNASDPECEAAREAMSANMDGETNPLAPSSLTEHLVSCPGCCAWYRGVLEIRRRMRLTLVPAMPDLAGQVLGGGQTWKPRSRRPGARWVSPG